MVRYVPGETRPMVRVLRVIADRTYERDDELEVPAASGQILFAFSGTSFRTHPRDMLYAYRLEGFDEDWQPSVRERQATYVDLPAGQYHFEVKAIDRDLNESEPARVPLSVIPDPRIQGLTEALSAGSVADEFVGESAVLRRVQAQLAEVARADVTVLILGETGTGKGLAARSLHAQSPRRHGPLIQVNCGALPEALVESELFGHERGAFTSAVSRKLGKVELAKGGMLFLDEIGDMSLEAQTKLLRLLEEGTFERVGGTETLTADVRVVAATNRDLPQMVEQGGFREDLYYRLQGFPVRLPPTARAGARGAAGSNRVSRDGDHGAGSGTGERRRTRGSPGRHDPSRSVRAPLSAEGAGAGGRGDQGSRRRCGPARDARVYPA